MKADKYLQSMIPSLDKMKIKEDLRNLSEELTSKTLPPYQAGKDFFNKDYKFKAKPLAELESRAKRSVDHRAPNLILLTLAGLEQANKNVGAVIDLVDKHYANDVVRDGMTYLKVNLLQYVESMSFLSLYARRLLLVAYGLEALGSETPDRDLSRDLQWVERRFDQFLVCLKANLMTEATLTKKLDDIPDIKVQEGTDATVRQTVGANKIDPMGFGFIAARFHPVYHVRKAILRFQNYRHKLAGEEKELLEFKLQNLKNQRDGKRDARLEETIERLEGRVSKMQFEMEEFENG